MMGSKLDMAIPYGQMAKERKDTIEKNRARHIWMGRDNEFKRLAGKPQDQVVLDLSAQKSGNQELASKLRAHNFNFGYTDKTQLEKDRVKRIAEAEKTLQDYTKTNSQQSKMMHEQAKQNMRGSHIKFGAVPSSSFYSSAQKSQDYFSKVLGQKGVTADQSARTDYCDKQRTVQKSVDLSARASERMPFNDLLPLRREGKKIDPAHVAGTTAVASHIASTEAPEPTVFDYQKLDPKMY